MILGMGASGTVLYLLVLVVLFYFILIKPQKKQANTRKQMLDALKVNDHIISVGGITGYIRDLNETYVYVEIAAGLVVEMTRQSVASVVVDGEDDANDQSASEDDIEEIEEPAAIEAAEEVVEEVTEKA